MAAHKSKASPKQISYVYCVQTILVKFRPNIQVNLNIFARKSAIDFPYLLLQGDSSDSKPLHQTYWL